MEKPPYRLGELIGYFLKLGTIGFGGPVALVGYMQRDLVEERRWIEKEDYLQGLALAQLAPGPLAAQTAMYLGYVHYGILGATLTGIAFVLPSFLMVVGLGWLYQRFGGLPWMQALFYGIGAAVIGIIARSAHKLTKLTLKKDSLLWGIFLAIGAVTVATRSEVAWTFLAAGLLVMLLRGGRLRKPGPMLAGVGFPLAVALPSWEPGLLTTIFLFFAKAGAFVFGSGLAIVPFLYAGTVREHHWLTEQQFLDAVAVAMITPGPVVITVGFIGYLVAGWWGAVVAALGTFLPCYLFTVIPAPFFKKYGKRPGIVAFVDGVTAAATGAIAGAVIVLGMGAIRDLPTALIAAVALAVLWIGKKIPEPMVIVAAAAAGLLLKGWGT